MLVNEVNVNLEPPKWADAALVGMEKQIVIDAAQEDLFIYNCKKNIFFND